MRFSALDGWRGICALLIALLHFEAYGHLYGVAFFKNAGLFVDFFFVLSGFVITHAYAARLNDAGEARTFMLRRIGRLWPLQVATLAVCLLLETIRSGAAIMGYPAESAPFSGLAMQPWAIVRNLLLIQALGFDHKATFNLPSWSISVEMYTYFLFSLFCLFARRHRIFFALAIAAGAALAVLYFTDGDLDADSYHFGIFRCAYGFFIGYLVYELKARYPQGRALAAGLEIPMVIFIAFYVGHTAASMLTMIAPIVFGATIYVFAAAAGPLSRLLISPPFRTLGRLSFSIYLVHSPILLAMILSERALEKLLHISFKIAVPGDGTIDSLWFFRTRWETDLITLVYLGAVLAVAATTHRFVEIPGRTFFNRIASKRKALLAAEISAAAQ